MKSMCEAFAFVVVGRTRTNMVLTQNLLRFSKSVVEAEVQKILNTELEPQKYNPVTCVQTSKDLCTKILSRVKELGYRRYKFVVQVVITSTSGQGIRVASRSLWDPHHDNYASVVYKNVCVSVVVWKCFSSSIRPLCLR